MKYFYEDKEKGKIEVEQEAWEWGVLYRPTAEQIKIGNSIKAADTEKQKDALRELKNRRAKLTSNVDAFKREYDTINKEISDIEHLIELPAQYEQDELHQFGNDGVFHRVGEIEQHRVELFSLFKADSIMTNRIDLVFTKGMRIIYKYRNVKPYYLDDYVKIYMFGYKLDGRYHYNFVLPDDRIIQSSFDNIDLPKFDLTKN